MPNKTKTKKVSDGKLARTPSSVDAEKAIYASKRDSRSSWESIVAKLQMSDRKRATAALP
jgi:hypothetical protein